MDIRVFVIKGLTGVFYKRIDKPCTPTGGKTINDFKMSLAPFPDDFQKE